MNVFPSRRSKVTKILWSQTTPPLVASGVEFAPYTTGTTVRVNAFARKEVIMAAGAIKVCLYPAYAPFLTKSRSQTPQLLQLSGIGDPNVLNPLGIKVLNNLPTVGKNLQEQVRKNKNLRSVLPDRLYSLPPS